MLPAFKYHPNPIETGAFQKGTPQKCDCCGCETDIWYESPFYSIDDVDCISKMQIMSEKYPIRTNLMNCYIVHPDI